MKVNMVTGLKSLSRWIRFQSAGGMGTQVPILVQRLRERGIQADIDGTGEYDIIHLHNPLPTLLPAVKRAQKKGAPVVIHARHIPELVKGGFKFEGVIHPLFNRYSRWLYNQADTVICATPYVERWMQSNGITSPTVVIPNGVDTTRFAPDPVAREKFRQMHGWKDECIVFSVGLLIPRKGVQDFIEVARRFTHHQRMQFVWVGSREPGLEHVDTTDTPPNTRFLGHVPFEDMAGVYAGGDIFLFPTYAESYGNVLFEAAAAGNVLVIRDIEIYREWFQHGNNCLKGNHAREFAAHIARIAEDAALRQQLQTGARKIAQEHDIGATVEKLADLYGSLIP
ncbi:MAG: glycosyltransferase family 4 protein [Candidatus Thermoplasmatota archaeon]|nr:glycosyltransferase family 4 protein [Candidatus Thermoplasmatota archaeon]